MARNVSWRTWKPDAKFVAQHYLAERVEVSLTVP
jgi:hypothetical protein